METRRVESMFPFRIRLVYYFLCLDFLGMDDARDCECGTNTLTLLCLKLEQKCEVCEPEGMVKPCLIRYDLT